MFLTTFSLWTTFSSFIEHTVSKQHALNFSYVEVLPRFNGMVSRCEDSPVPSWISWIIFLSCTLSFMLKKLIGFNSECVTCTSRTCSSLLKFLSRILPCFLNQNYFFVSSTWPQKNNITENYYSWRGKQQISKRISCGIQFKKINSNQALQCISLFHWESYFGKLKLSNIIQDNFDFHNAFLI